MRCDYGTNSRGVIFSFFLSWNLLVCFFYIDYRIEYRDLFSSFALELLEVCSRRTYVTDWKQKFLIDPTTTPPSHLSSTALLLYEEQRIRGKI